MIKKIFEFIKKIICVAFDAVYWVLSWIGRSIKSLFMKILAVLRG